MKLLWGFLLFPFSIALDTRIYDIQDQEYAPMNDLSLHFDQDFRELAGSEEYTGVDDKEYVEPESESFALDQARYESSQDYDDQTDNQDFDEGIQTGNQDYSDNEQTDNQDYSDDNETENQDYSDDEQTNTQDFQVDMSAKEFQSEKAETLNQMSPSFRALIKNEDSADDTEVDDKAPLDDASKKYGIPSNSPYTIVAGILLICMGAFMLFFGQKAFKPILFLSGAYIFGVFMYALLNYLRTHKVVTMEKNVPLIYFGSITGAALVGGLFFLCLWKLAAYLFGAALGFIVAVFFLSLPFTVNFNQTVRIVILAVFVVLGIIFGAFFEKPILIITTATLGSYWLFAGVDVFLKTGFGSLVRAMRDRQRIEMKVGTWLMLSGFLLMTIIGSIIQFRIARRATATYAPVSKV